MLERDEVVIRRKVPDAAWLRGCLREFWYFRAAMCTALVIAVNKLNMCMLSLKGGGLESCQAALDCHKRAQLYPRGYNWRHTSTM